MKQRKPEYPVERLIINRWSPRAMSGAPMSDEELMPLFEAARWAPSSFNNQSWRFIYAHRDTPEWDTLFDLLVAFNQSWAKNAAALVVIISRNTFEKTGKPSRTSSFDTGSAWQNLALQATSMNIVVHGMEGFSYDKARKQLNVPDGYTIEAMAAVGKPASELVLPDEQQEREEPSGRKPLSEIVTTGTFTFDE